MLAKSNPHAKRKHYFFIALVVVVADQFTKWLVDSRLALHESINIIPGLFRLTHVQNQGAAFGILSDHPSEWKLGMLIFFSLFALVVVSTLLWRNSHSINSTGIALSLILGGAIGNLWDRMVAGHVTDFLDVYFRGYHWPAFNIADSAIVIGALVLMAEIVFSKAEAKESPTVQGRL
jgi:signal peptidase II